MLKNYVNEAYLKTFVPELARYLWSGETTFDGFKQATEQVVTNDFINRGYRPLALRPDLYLRTDTSTLNTDTTGTSYQDKYNRLRLAYNVTVRTGTTALVLKGSNDESTWTTIQTTSITGTGEGSFVFISAFKYYRLDATITAGTLAYTAWLTESNYDLFFTYYWLYLILLNAGKGTESRYTEYANIFLGMYNALWQAGLIVTDENADGTADTEKKPSLVRAGR